MTAAITNACSVHPATTINSGRSKKIPENLKTELFSLRKSDKLSYVCAKAREKSTSCGGVAKIQ
jgi:hypothetical protein